MKTVESASGLPDFPALVVAPPPTAPGLRSSRVSSDEPALLPTISPESRLKTRPDAEPETRPPTVGEIIRRALYTPHFVYAATVPSALARSLREPSTQEPSRLDLRV